MHFLIDASLPRSAAPMLRQLGHDVTDVRDIGLGSATDDSIAAHAQSQRLTLVTRDFDFADFRNYPPADFSGLSSCVYLKTQQLSEWCDCSKRSPVARIGSPG